jgi:hypothetical protein
MTLEIAEIIVYGICLVSLGFATGWASSVGRLAATQSLDDWPPKTSGERVYRTATASDGLTDEEAIQFLKSVGRADGKDPFEKASVIFESAVGLHRHKREERRVKDGR